MLQTSAKPLPPLQGTFPASGDGIFIASAKLPLLLGLVFIMTVHQQCFPLEGGSGPIGPIGVKRDINIRGKHCAITFGYGKIKSIE